MAAACLFEGGQQGRFTMQLRHILSATAIAALTAFTLLSGPVAVAQAQQSATTAPAGGSDLREAEDDSMMVQPFNISVDDFEDMDVEGANGEDVGEIEEVLVDASGQPVAVAVEVGGFLGIGEKTVVIRLDQLQREQDLLRTSLTKDQIEQLPEWDD